MCVEKKFNCLKNITEGVFWKVVRSFKLFFFVEKRWISLKNLNVHYWKEQHKVIDKKWINIFEVLRKKNLYFTTSRIVTEIFLALQLTSLTLLRQNQNKFFRPFKYGNSSSNNISLRTTSPLNLSKNFKEVTEQIRKIQFKLISFWSSS